MTTWSSANFACPVARPVESVSVYLAGFGGESQFWDYNLESFTLMAALAAVTERIKLYAPSAVLTLPPALVARMATTIDDIAPGRFGINIVSGWAPAEYQQMGL